MKGPVFGGLTVGANSQSTWRILNSSESICLADSGQDADIFLLFRFWRHVASEKGLTV